MKCFGHHHGIGRRVNIFLEKSVNAGFKIHLMVPYFALYNLPSLVYQSPYLELAFIANRCNRELTVAVKGCLSGIWKPMSIGSVKSAFIL